jgi:AcrR family transcriptional regulator
MTRRSDATRAKILTAARERFAADGYERATIRAIAADAGIDPAMVMRYYVNKEGLFAAAADFDLRLPDLAGTPSTEYGTTLARHFLNRWDGDETMTALLRASTSNPTAVERMQAIFTGQVGPTLLKIVADPATVARRAGLLASQMLGFALCRYVLRLPPIVEMPAAEAVGWLGPTLQRYLLE